MAGLWRYKSVLPPQFGVLVGNTMRYTAYARTASLLDSGRGQRFYGQTGGKQGAHEAVAAALKEVQSHENTALRRATLVSGDGIGPEVTASVVGVFAAAGAPVEWETFGAVGPLDSLALQRVVTSIHRNGVCLKGPLFTPVEGWASRNHQLRTSLDLFANVVPVRSVPGVSPHQGLDFVVIRENTEAEYSGLEHEVVPGVVQSMKVITTKASLRIARFAFGYARQNQRKKVTAVHKANIQKLSDGEFLECCRTVAKEFPDIQYQEMIVDNTAMQLVMNPSQFDVLLTPNLYGNIVENIGAGLVGSLGLVPGVNVGLRGHALFESGNRHVGLDITGKDRANPVGTLYAGVQLLRYLHFHSHADRIESALDSVLADRKVLTRDLGGKASTSEFTKAVIDRLV